MAYYVVTIKDKKYVNTEFAKELFGLSNVELVKKLCTNEIKSTEVLGDLLIEIANKPLGIAESAYSDVTYQNLTEQLSAIKTSTESADAYVLDAETMLFDSVRFVRLNDVLCSNKYNMRHKMATIKLFSSIYVALNSELKDRTKGIFVVTDKVRK